MSLLKVFIFPDLLREELLCIESCVEQIKNLAEIEVYRVTETHEKFFKKASIDSPAWIVSKDWRRAIDFLSVSKNPNKTFVSVLSSQSKPLTPWETWFRTWTKRIPNQVVLVTHSALSYQFLRDLAGIAENQLLRLPLALPTLETHQVASGEKFIVGTFCSFTAPNNLHFILTLAHYLQTRDPEIQVKIVGTGPLKHHLNRLVTDLNLGKQVQIIESQDPSWVDQFDVSLNFSSHNDHFIPELLSGASGVVPLSIQVQGIEDYIQDSHNGFIIPLDETKTAGELVLTLKQNPLLLREMGSRFRNHTMSYFGAATVAPLYLETFGIAALQNKNFIRCAR